MLVVSDTSPLSALLLSKRDGLLRRMFERVVIPPAVKVELLCAHSSLPEWIEVIEPCAVPDSVAFAGLDPGETAAIALALELRPEAVLIDERLGRRLASEHHLPVTGLLGLFVLAKQRGFVAEVVPLIRDVQVHGNCWFGGRLIHRVCESVGEVWE